MGHGRENIFVLHDPDHGTNDFFVVENRQRRGAQDRDAADTGLVVYRCNMTSMATAHDAQPPLEVMRPNATKRRFVPACGAWDNLAEAGEVGDALLRPANMLRLPGRAYLPFDLLIDNGIDRRDDPDPFDAEVVRVVDMDEAVNVLFLESPLKRPHPIDDPEANSRIAYRSVNWVNSYFKGFMATSHRMGVSTIALTNTTANLPPTGKTLNFEGDEQHVVLRASVDATTGLTLIELDGTTLGAAMPRGTKVSFSDDNFCNGPGDDAAWDTADPRTASFSTMARPWWNGANSRVAVRGIPASGTVMRVFFDGQY